MVRLSVCLACLIPLILYAQRNKEKETSLVITQPDRIEFTINDRASDFFVISGDLDGLLVLEDSNEPANEGGGSIWKLHLIDTAFNLVWSRKYNISAKGSFIGYEYFGGRFYLLFNQDFYASGKLAVYQLNLQSDEIISYNLKTAFPIDINYFESVGETLIIAGYANYRPVVVTYNINEKLPRIVPGFYDKRSDMLDLVVDKRSRLFTIIMSERMKNKRQTIRVKTFTDRGEIIQDNLVNPGDKKNLLDGASTTFSGGLQYLAGTHSKKSIQYSQGFYLSKFINGQQQVTKYYPFASLTNFWDYLKPKREERILKRINKKKEKGKIKKFNYRLLVHDILEKDDHYILIGEAFYPRYNYSARSAFGSPGFGGSRRSSSYSNPYFLGYKYTHAVVVGFDRNCSILWDHTFKIEDVQTYSLDKNVAISGSKDKVALMYLKENEIRSKVIEGDKVIEGRTFNPLKLTFDSDKIENKNPSLEKIEQWYGNTLFAYGKQSIKRQEPVAGQAARKVFYINKIVYDLGREVD